MTHADETFIARLTIRRPRDAEAQWDCVVTGTTPGGGTWELRTDERQFDRVMGLFSGLKARAIAGRHGPMERASE